MSRCRNCGPGTCSCEFESSADAEQTGNGRSYAPINWRPISVPLPRPFGHMYLVDVPTDSTVAATTEKAVKFGGDYVPFDGGMINPAIDTTSQTRLTCPVGGDGYYLTWGYLSVDRTGYTLGIRKNGSEYIARQTGASELFIPPFFHALHGCERSVNSMIDLVAGDYLELVIISTSDAGNIIGSTDIGTRYDVTPQFWAQWIRGL